MLKLFLITLILIGAAVAAIAIKMFLKKNGEFKKYCATIEFENGEKIGCVCTSQKHEDCKYYALHHPEEYTKSKQQNNDQKNN